MDFIAFDFETANNNKGSICSLGFCVIENFHIISEKYYLIDPQENFNFRNINIHGITPDMVVGAPEFPAVWNEISDLFCKYPLVAHSAKTAEIPMMRNVFEKYNMKYPDVKIYDTSEIAKINLDLPNNKLETVARHYNIDLINHHNALDDARTAAKIMIMFLNENFHIYEHYLDKSTNPNDISSYKFKSIIVDKLNAPKQYNRFKNINEKNNYLISSKIYRTSDSMKKLFYCGIYSDNQYCICNPVGYIDKNTIVISIDNHLHCINTDCFAEMQPKVKDIPLYEKNIPLYVPDRKGTENEQKICNFFKSSIDYDFSDCDISIKFNRSDYNSIVVNIEPNAFRLGNETSSLLARICDQNKGYVSFSFSSDLKEIFDTYGLLYQIKSDFIEISLELFCFYIETKPEDLRKIVNKLFWSSFSFTAFGCCSRYKECSKAKNCIHPDLLYATACQYRKNLEKGKIFY